MSKKIPYFLLFLIIFFQGFGQDVSFDFGKNKINLEEKFFIKISIKGIDKRPILSFPEIEGFKKADKPASTGVSMQDGKSVYIHTLIQNYIPTKEGTFKLNKGNFQIQAKSFSYDEFLITVFDPFKVETKPKKIVFLEIKDNAQLSLLINKKSVYKGEGIQVVLFFNVPEGNKAEIEFQNDLAAKIEEFELKLKPKNCWEEKNEILEIKPKIVQINGKTFTQYKLYESIFYPIDEKTITFPSVSLQMNKYRISNDENSSQKKKDTKIYSTERQSVSIKKLPTYPSDANIIVGDFQVNEKIEKKTVTAGESFNYEFKVSGKGNFNLINQADLTNDENFDFYPPTIKFVKNENDYLQGNKSFKYNIVAKKIGTKQLDKYINFVFFNTKTIKYDTLKASILIEVIGKNLNKDTLQTVDEEILGQSIFDGIENQDSSESYFNLNETINKLSNILAIIMFAFLIFLGIKNYKN